MHTNVRVISLLDFPLLHLTCRRSSLIFLLQKLFADIINGSLDAALTITDVLADKSWTIANYR